MFIGHFTERPYQDPESGYFGATGLPIKDLSLSNEIYDPILGSDPVSYTHLTLPTILLV